MFRAPIRCLVVATAVGLATEALAQQGPSAALQSQGGAQTPPPRSQSPSPDDVIVTAPRRLPAPTTITGSAEKDRELQAAEERKAAIIFYRDHVGAPYPGLRCVFRSDCRH
jgi:hypothetical protein